MKELLSFASSLLLFLPAVSPSTTLFALALLELLQARAPDLVEFLALQSEYYTHVKPYLFKISVSHGAIKWCERVSCVNAA